jgi:hypothetical protein
MIQKLRSIIASILAALLMLITLNKVQLNRTGRATASDDSDSKRAAVTRKADHHE